MATKADIYKASVDFAYDTLNVSDQKELTSQALARFDSLLFGNADWEFWIANVGQQRDRMTSMKTQKVSAMKQPPPQAATPDTTQAS